MKARAFILIAAAVFAVGGTSAFAAGGRTAQTSSATIRAAEIRGDGLNRLYHLGRYASDAMGLSSAEARAMRLRGDALNKRYHLGAYAPRHDTWFNYAVSLGSENPAASTGQRFITDTLGGNGRQSQPTVYDTWFNYAVSLGTGNPSAPTGQRVITDTLAPGGSPSTGVGSSSSGFSWTTAGVATGSAIGVALLLAGGILITVRRRGRLAI
ncbi:MAG TPA: hypothetical protein VGH82_15180 [Gaiellaceae bacterium]|jgi:hypothetical protein